MHTVRRKTGCVVDRWAGDQGLDAGAVKAGAEDVRLTRPIALDVNTTLFLSAVKHALCSKTGSCRSLCSPVPSALAMYSSADEGPIRFMSMKPFEPEPGVEPGTVFCATARDA